MSFNPTIERLVKFTDYSEFERLSCDLLNRLEYHGLEPSNVKGTDGGKDGLLFRDDENIIFHFSCREDWKSKLLNEDLEKTKERDTSYDRLVFVTNRKVSGQESDQVRKEIKEQHGLDLDLFHAERIRSLLDSAHKDLRKTYLGIDKNYSSHVDDRIRGMINEKDEYLNAITKTDYSRILIIAVPNKLDEKRMEFFDELHNFVADKSNLTDTLSIGIPYEMATLSTSINSESVSVTYEAERQKPRNMFNRAISDPEPEVDETKIHRDGTLSLMFDLNYKTFKPGMSSDLLSRFFEMMDDLYEQKVKDEEFITVALAIVNADNAFMKKDIGQFNGEEWLFLEKEENKFESWKEEEFRDKMKEKMENKLKYFFNDRVEVEN